MPDGTGFAERLIPMLKESLRRATILETVENLRQAPLAFPETSDEPRRIGRHKHRSPARFGRDRPDSKIMAAQAQTRVS